MVDYNLIEAAMLGVAIVTLAVLAAVSVAIGVTAHQRDLREAKRRQEAEEWDDDPECNVRVRRRA